MKKLFLLTILIFSILLLSCPPPGEGSAGGFEVTISLFKTDSAGLPVFPFIHSDSASALIQIVTTGEDGSRVIVRERNIELQSGASYASTVFDDLGTGYFELRVTTYNKDGDVRSFGTRGVELLPGGNTIQAKLGPAIASFTVTGEGQSIQGIIDGPYIEVMLPGEAFVVSGWTAVSSRGANEDVWISGEVYPEGGAPVIFGTANGIELVDYSSFVMNDLTKFNAVVGFSDDFYITTHALNSLSELKIIGSTDYHVIFTYDGQVDLSDVEPPIFSPVEGFYDSIQNIEISCATPGAEIRYTIDGTNPGETSGILYTAPIALSTDTTIRAAAFKAGMDGSTIQTAEYTFGIPVETPSFSLDGGSFTAVQSVEISTSTSGAEIMYTIDGTTPSRTNGTLYTGSLSIFEDTSIRAFAYKDGMSDSEVAVSGAFFFDLPDVAPPVFDLVGGSYSTEQDINITCSTPGAEIRYTLDGSEPTFDKGNIVTGSIHLSRATDTTIRAMAHLIYMDDSSAVSSSYEIYHTVPANVIAVDIDAPGGGDGVSWESAYNDLQTAIDFVDGDAGFDEVWVMEGTYYPLTLASGIGSGGDSRAVHFTMMPDVRIHGGFEGTEWSLLERDIWNHETILSGDIDGTPDSVNTPGAGYLISGNAGNAYHVLYIPAAAGLSNAVLDGFIITGGNADGGVTTNGGGVFLDQTGSGVLFSNCVFLNNQAAGHGGAVYLNTNTSPAFLNVLFIGNKTAGQGGGVRLESNTAFANFMNTVFWGNWSGGQGGGVLWNTSGGSMMNTTLVNNYAAGSGGAACSLVGSQTIKNIIAWASIGGNDFTYGGPQPGIDNSLVETSGGYSVGTGTVNLVIDSGADPLFIDIDNPQGADGIWMTSDDGYLIQSGSTAEALGDNSIMLDIYDFDSDLNVSEPFPYDILLQERIIGGVIDAGANEVQ